MPFNHFTKDAREVVVQARTEAARSGSATVEAEHLLLALSALDGPPARALADAGADHDRLTVALRDEREAALNGIGISAADYDLPEPTPRAAAGDLRFATSAKAALQNAAEAVAERKGHRIEGTHVLLGVLAADHGTVPRALRIAGIDRDRLRAAARNG